MTDLVLLVGNVPVVSTLDMCDGLNIDHHSLIHLVRKYDSLFQGIRPFIYETKQSGGRPTIYCYLDEEQATFLINLMRNSTVVVQFKYRLTREFFRIKKMLLDQDVLKRNMEWLECRAAGKAKRKEETDVIKNFVKYATTQGSKNAEKYYANLTTMENRALFFIEQKFKNLREMLNTLQLAVITCADSIVMKALEDGMDQNLPYKDIYQLAKKRIEVFAEVHGKTIIPMRQLTGTPQKMIAN